jgi:NAD(P)-dependent dehydrogenase (short-subunit alcohol dehydrogenase family)
MRLKDKVAIITGAGRGMGRSDALLFAKEGAKVVVCDINFENASLVAKEVQDAGGEAFAIKTDVTKLEEVGKLVEET